MKKDYLKKTRSSKRNCDSDQKYNKNPWTQCTTFYLCELIKKFGLDVHKIAECMELSDSQVSYKISKIRNDPSSIGDYAKDIL